MIRFENIRKKGVLNNVTFTLDGGRTCVLSEREADAAAIITSACGLNVPDSGSVITKGDVRFIAKNAPLPSFLTVKEYVSTVRSIIKSTDIPAITAETESKYGNTVIGTLSDLERYYVALSVALIGSPVALAISDPFHGVQFEQREALNEYLDKISEAAPIIYNSYFPSLCRENEQVIVLSSGKCVGSGKADDVFNSQSPTLVCRVKGNIDRLNLSSIEAEYEISPAENGMYDITFTYDGSELREGVREAIASSGMALLSVKGEHDELKRVIASLDNLESEEADRFAAFEEPKKLSADNLSIANEYEQPEPAPAKASKLKMIGFYSDEDEEEQNDKNESTLFSDEGGDED